MIGVSVVNDDVTRMGQYCAEAERAGFNILGIGDSPGVRPEMTVEATVCALSTSRMRFGPRVTNPVTRDLVTLASAMASLQHLSGGRCVLGIGAGDSAVYQAGLRPARLAEFEEAVIALSDLLHQRPASYRGNSLRLEWQVPACPIWMAAAGPRTLELAGRIADGVILSNGVDAQVVEDSLAVVDRGARQAGRSLEDLELWWSLGIGVGPPEEVNSQLAGMAAAYANQAFRFSFGEKRVPAAIHGAATELMRRYDAYNHMTTRKDGWNAALLEDSVLREHVFERFIVSGEPDECAERINAIRRRGASNLWFTMPLHDRTSFFETWSTRIAPQLGVSA